MKTSPSVSVCFKTNSREDGEAGRALVNIILQRSKPLQWILSGVRRKLTKRLTAFPAIIKLIEKGAA